MKLLSREIGSMRQGAGLCLLAIACAPAYANADASYTVGNAAASDHYHSLINRLERMEGVRGVPVIRYELLNLGYIAELDDKLSARDFQATFGSKGTIAVIFPDLEEPYRSIFLKIIEGIEQKAGVPVRSYPVNAKADADEMNAQLKRNGTRVVIALGRQGLKTASGIDRDIPVVVGGVVSMPEQQSRDLTGVSLTPDPALLFARLKNLLPDVRRVIVIYDPRNNEWLMKMARDAAKLHGLELVAHEVRDLAAAARMYESAFAGADGRRDALWLPQDATTVDENTILPLVLKESWNRGVPVFSSSFLHVKKGALFALYPNNVELGRTLATSALGVLTGESGKRGVAPLREVHIAVNLRTASHIGLSIGYQQQRLFDSVFP